MEAVDRKNKILVGPFVQYFLLCGACDLYGIFWYFTVFIGTFSVPFGALWRFWYMFVLFLANMYDSSCSIDAFLKCANVVTVMLPNNSMHIISHTNIN